MERLNFELSFDANLNVKQPIAASACWVGRRAIGEYSSKRSIWNALTVAPPLVGTAAPTASPSTYRTVRMCKSRSHSRTLRSTGGKREGYLPALLIRVMNRTLPCFYPLLWHRGKYTIKTSLFLVFTRLFSKAVWEEVNASWNYSGLFFHH